MNSNHALNASIEFAINIIKHDLSKQHYRIKNDDSRLAELRQYLPYTLQPTATEGIYILLNRRYQLLGSNVSASIPMFKYDDFTGAHIRMTTTQLDSMRSNSHGLYSDIDAPWFSRKKAKAYLIRLQSLQDVLMSNYKVRQ